jgi:hypothetical protein
MWEAWRQRPHRLTTGSAIEPVFKRSQQQDYFSWKQVSYEKHSADYQSLAYRAYQKQPTLTTRTLAFVTQSTVIPFLLIHVANLRESGTM